jgi:acyl transferase domain-containing protein
MLDKPDAAANSTEGGYAFLFSPQGAQWPAMGQQVYNKWPIVRDVIAECDEAIQHYLGWSLIREFTQEGSNYRLHSDPGFIQPALTALQIALARLLLSRGYQLCAVAGMSMGEIAAAHTAGILTLPQAMKIACCQARLAESNLRPGKMILTNLGREDVQKILVASGSSVSIGVHLSPSLTVLSGEANALGRITAILDGLGVAHSEVRTAFAFHSQEVISMRQEFKDCIHELRPIEGKVPFYSSVTGGVYPGNKLGKEHWWKIMSEPSIFQEVTSSLIHDGYDTFVEIGAHPILADPVLETARALDRRVTVMTTLQWHRAHRTGLQLPMLAFGGTCGVSQESTCL